MDNEANGHLETYFASPERTTRDKLLKVWRRMCSNEIITKLLDSMLDPALLLNQHRQVIAANAKMLEKLGLRSVHEIIGQRLGEMLSCEFVEQSPSGCGTGQKCTFCGLTTAVLRSLEVKEQIKCECRVLLVNKYALDLEVVTKQETIDGIKIIFTVLRDISCEKRREVLEHTFTHDLYNTICDLKKLSKLYGSAENIAEVEDFRINLEYQSETLAKEIIGQRKLIEAENGSLQLDLQRVLASDVLRQVYSLFSRYQVTKDHKLIFERMDDVYIETDIELLRRILENIVKNALEADTEGERVTFGVKEKNGLAIFFVNNPGVMPINVQMQVFQRSFSTKGSGRGIGTYSNKLFGEKYLGGKVAFTSNIENGTTFTFKLQACARPSTDKLASATTTERDEASIPIEAEVADQAKSDPETKLGSGYKILVADDGLTNRIVAKLFLQNHGFEVDEVENGALAVEALSNRAYNLVFMDMDMPVMDGLEATRRIRDVSSPVLDHNIPILAMTAKSTAEDMDLCIKAGMNDFVSKPIQRHEFSEIVLKYLSRKVTNSKDASNVIQAIINENRDRILDRKHLMDIVDDEKIWCELIEEFINENTVKMKVLKEALERKDAENVQLAAHSIKGNAASIGAGATRDAALALEEAGSKNNFEHSDQMIECLEEAFESFKKVFEDFKGDE